jgi:hypothetical protein
VVHAAAGAAAHREAGPVGHALRRRRRGWVTLRGREEWRRGPRPSAVRARSRPAVRAAP